MATRRTIGARVRSLDDYDVTDILCFLSGWSPPTFPHERETSRWRTFAEFASDYESVRGELQARFPPHRDRKEPFGECVLRFRRRYGLAALDECASSSQIRAADCD